MENTLASKNKIVRDAVQKRFLERHPDYHKRHRENNREKYQAAGRRHYDTHKEEVNKRSLDRYYRLGEDERMRRYKVRLKNLYGITVDEFWDWIEKQEGRCPVCLDLLNFSKTRPCVDHDHVTGKVRGVLHRQCNASLGQFGDDPIRLRRAAEYLERSSL